MQINVEQKDVKEAWPRIATAVPKDSSDQLLHIEASGDSAVFTITTPVWSLHMFVPANVVRAGKVSIPARVALDLMTEDSFDSISLKVTTNKVHLNAADSSYVIDWQETPQEVFVSAVEPTETFRVDGRMMADLVRRVRVAGDDDQSTARFATHGEQLRVDVTEKYRAALAYIPGARLVNQFQLPCQPLRYLTRIAHGEMSVEVTERNVAFRTDKGALLVRRSTVIKGDINELIDSEVLGSVSLNRATFLGILKRMGMFNSDIYTTVGISVVGPSLSVKQHVQLLGSGTETMKVTPVKNQLNSTHNFNLRNLAAGVSQCAGQSITIEFSEAHAFISGVLDPIGFRYVMTQRRE